MHQKLVFSNKSLKDAISWLRMEGMANVLMVPRQEIIKFQTDLGCGAEDTDVSGKPEWRHSDVEFFHVVFPRISQHWERWHGSASLCELGSITGVFWG